MAESFLSWRRPALSTLIPSSPPLLDGRISANFPVALTDDAGATENVPVPFVLTGPQDVLQVNPRAVVTRRPTPGSVNVEVTHAPYVELAEADLPWRYSPKPNVAAGIQPWLVLLVGETGRELTVGNGTVLVSGAALDAHNLDLSASWAHVHQIPEHPDIARILAPRVFTDEVGTRSALREDTDHTVVLVPAWLPGSKATDPPERSWPATGNTTRTLPCYDSWTFRTTAEDDDFRKIAERLNPLTTAEEAALAATKVGRASIRLGPAGPGRLDLGGAITLPDGPAPSPLKRATAAATSKLARVQRTPQGRWVLALPRYDGPWANPPDGEPVPARLRGWRKQLHQDPRHRGVAGLGAWAGIAWQDRIADAASAQAGAIFAAAERVRHLGLGLQASRSQWDRRVPEDPQRAMVVLAPMLRRLPTTGTDTSTAMDVMSGRTAWLTPALFSSAARRLLRPRATVARDAKAGARRLPRLAGVAATTCPPPPKPLPGQGPLADRLADPAAARAAVAALQQNVAVWVPEAFAAIDESDRLRRPPPIDGQGLVIDPNIPPGDTSDGVRDPDRDHLASHLGELPGEVIGTVGAAARPVSRCRPVTPEVWVGVTTAVVKGINPNVKRPVVVDRVLGGFEGLREPMLSAPEFAPELDIPLWSFLRDNAPDWLLPGGGAVPLDRVLALATNQEFVDAFMIGVNQQTLAELRRRNIPMMSGWTPLRRFWQRIDDTGVATDIEPVLDVLTEPAPGRPRWPEGTPLGDADHQRDAATSQLVILLHTELFRRYPATQVYLVANPGGDVWGDPPDVSVVPRVKPILSGAVEAELVFFGFPLSPQQAASHWLVLEEPPPGYRFRTPSAAEQQLSNGGRYAASTLDPPVRAFFGNLL